MRNHQNDLTLMRNYIQKFRFLIREYELIKAKKHPRFKFVTDFYKAHGITRQTFLKYYNRFRKERTDKALLPQKRGPKYRTRRFIPYIEEKVRQLRLLGMNQYEIVKALTPILKDKTPSPSGVYNILKRLGLNRLTKPIKEKRRQIIKKKIGEMAHIDVHHLSKGLIHTDSKRRYLVCVVDSCSRIAWAEIVDDIQSLTVMFATMRCFNILLEHYQIRFCEVLTDNGAEFGTRASKNKKRHPFERMLLEMGIKHRYTRPYRPQTNGKVERFWRTIEEDLLAETTFDSLDDLKKELVHYLYYYNHERPHQGIGGKTPVEFAKSCQRII